MEFSARLLAIRARKHFVPQAIVVHPIRRRPGPYKLARRWEGMCINASDQGASFLRMAFNLPWHALRVIQSRFRGEEWSLGNVGAAALFAAELVFVVSLSPGWALKWSRSERSEFWANWVATHGPVPKYGF
jgi:hypothetical protein